jgi:hypothetical protein
MIRKSKTLKTYFDQGIYTYNGTRVQRYSGATMRGILDERARGRESRMAGWREGERARYYITI